MKKGPVITAKAIEHLLVSLFSKKPNKIKRVHGGLVNEVFEADVGREQVIVRASHEPSKLQVFLKEQWAINTARRHGVPTAEVLEVGNSGQGFPYMVLYKVPGKMATGSRDKESLLNSLGEYAAIVNSIPTKSFGHLFDWSPNRLSRHLTWKDYLDNELHVDERCELFARSGVLEKPKLKQLQQQLRQIRAWRNKPVLCHGDIPLKNVMVDENRKIIAILDWEHCTSNIAPAWELSVALHDLTMDEKEMFLRGYGLDLKKYMKLAPSIKALNILNYASTVKDAMRKDDKAQLLSLRTRLNGNFDLYSL